MADRLNAGLGFRVATELLFAELVVTFHWIIIHGFVTVPCFKAICSLRCLSSFAVSSPSYASAAL